MTKLLTAIAAVRSGATAVECAFVVGLIGIAGILAWEALVGPL